MKNVGEKILVMLIATTMFTLGIYVGKSYNPLPTDPVSRTSSQGSGQGTWYGQHKITSQSDICVGQEWVIKPSYNAENIKIVDSIKCNVVFYHLKGWKFTALQTVDEFLRTNIPLQ